MTTFNVMRHDLTEAIKLALLNANDDVDYQGNACAVLREISTAGFAIIPKELFLEMCRAEDLTEAA